MRDSLFCELIMPEEKLGMQIYLYLTDRGRTGYNVSVWGSDPEPVALKLEQGTVGADADFDAFEFKGLSFTQPEPLRTCRVRYESDDVTIAFDFEPLHEAFSYRANPDGLPSWFAENRTEQTGHVRGYIDVRGRRVEWDRTGHRDHSWGVRDWGIPQHWKWFIAYTESGRAVNGWIWIARGEWGRLVDDAVPSGQPDHAVDVEDHVRRLPGDVHDVGLEPALGHVVVVVGVVPDVRDGDRRAVPDDIPGVACSAGIDGEPGAGQFETHWPSGYLQYLTANGGQ